MKKPGPTPITSQGIDADAHSIDVLLEQIRNLVQAARKTASTAINSLQVITNFEIGRMIIEHEQQGAERAAYGKQILKDLSIRLTEEFGRGFSEDNLALMRRFYMAYRGRKPISETASGKLLRATKNQTTSEAFKISETQSRKMVSPVNGQTQSSPFSLSWSHYAFLLGIKHVDERNFYEIEASIQNWSVRELKRQFDSSLFERLALSRDKKKIHELSQMGQLVTAPQDVLKNPYVLEFLGLEEKTDIPNPIWR